MNEESDIEDSLLLAQISNGDKEIESHWSKLISYSAAKSWVRFLIVFVGVICCYFSVTFQPGSNAQSFMANITAGIGVFIAAAPVLKSIRSRPGVTLSMGVLATIGLLIAAYFSGPASQPVLLSGGCGVLLLLALDLNVAQWLDAISRLEGNARKKLDEARSKVENANSILDYKYAIHDYLNVPKPYQLGGIRIPKGQTFLGILGWENPDDSDINA